MRHLSDRWRAKESTMGLHRLICRAISRWQHHRNHVPSAAASQGPADDFLCSLFTCPDAGYRPPVPLWLHIRQQQQHMFRIPMISSPHFQICNSYDFNMHFSA